MGSLWVPRLKNDCDKRVDFWVHLGPIWHSLHCGLSKSCTGIPSERVSEARLPRNELCPHPNPKLPCEASLILRNGFSSKMNQNKRWSWSNTNTNTQIQIQIQIRTHKYKYKYRTGLRSQILTFFQKIKVSTKTAISLEPLDLHPLNTTQIEALGVLDLKNTSGGL